jgi:hypothetical protein
VETAHSVFPFHRATFIWLVGCKWIRVLFRSGMWLPYDENLHLEALKRQRSKPLRVKEGIPLTGGNRGIGSSEIGTYAAAGTATPSLARDRYPAASSWRSKSSAAGPDGRLRHSDRPHGFDLLPSSGHRDRALAAIILARDKSFRWRVQESRPCPMAARIELCRRRRFLM